jgi:hypothetical protein
MPTTDIEASPVDATALPAPAGPLRRALQKIATVISILGLCGAEQHQPRDRNVSTSHFPSLQGQGLGPRGAGVQRGARRPRSCLRPVTVPRQPKATAGQHVNQLAVRGRSARRVLTPDEYFPLQPLGLSDGISAIAVLTGATVGAKITTQGGRRL